jgi:hypothetical protein
MDVRSCNERQGGEASWVRNKFRQARVVRGQGQLIVHRRSQQKYHTIRNVRASSPKHVQLARRVRDGQRASEAGWDGGAEKLSAASPQLLVLVPQLQPDWMDDRAKASCATARMSL